MSPFWLNCRNESVDVRLVFVGMCGSGFWMVSWIGCREDIRSRRRSKAFSGNDWEESIGKALKEFGAELR